MNYKFYSILFFLLVLTKTVSANILISSVSTNSFWQAQKTICNTRHDGKTFQKEITKAVSNRGTMILSIATGYYWIDETNKANLKNDKNFKIIVRKGTITPFGSNIIKTYKDKRLSYSCVEFPIYFSTHISPNIINGKIHISDSGNTYHIHASDGKIYGKREFQDSDVGDLDYVFSQSEVATMQHFLSPFKNSNSITLNKSQNSNRQATLNIFKSILSNRVVFNYDSFTEYVYMIRPDNNWYLQKIYRFNSKENNSYLKLEDDPNVIDTLNFTKDVLRITARY